VQDVREPARGVPPSLVEALVEHRDVAALVLERRLLGRTGLLRIRHQRIFLT
jgi:hypothetical protein